MTKERLFKQEYAAELLRIAKNDFEAAKTLMTNSKIRSETVFFQLHQSVEKALKAVLIHQKKMVPLVHDIRIIIDRLKAPPPHAEALTELTDFAAIRRYEEGSFVLTADEIRAATAAVQNVLDFCDNEINS